MFFINQAVGGASRWPINLSRHGGIAEMYIDYVRVYHGQPNAASEESAGSGAGS